MASIGETLRHAREQQGISLDQAEEDTKIRRRYLEALEDEEYEVIPGAVYAKGFLRNYAGYLGLNPEEVMIEYKLKQRPVKEAVVETENDKPDIAESISKRRAAQRTNRKIYRLTVVVAAVAIITFALYSMISKNSENNPGQDQGNGTQQTEQNNNAENQGGGQTQNQNQNSTGNKPEEPAKTPEESTSDSGSGDQGNQNSGTAAKQVSLVLAVGNQPCWARVTVDGKTVFTGNLASGETKSFQGKDKIVFRLGNAGAVNVNINGKPRGVLGAPGQVVTQEVTTQD